ncbi:MAG: SRPBCC domain-containing protein [Ferruginibacter sp.]
MDNELYVKNNILINASAAKVWDVLTNPEQTKKYMFGSETVSDWQRGSSLLWTGNYEGKEMVFVKGEIVDIEPGKFLAYTTIDPNSTIDDVSENYLTVTYRLSDKEGHTMLTVTQGDYSKVAEGERRYNEAYNNGEGWNPILVEIKKIAEAEEE